MNKTKTSEWILRKADFPEYIEKKRGKCWVCGEYHCVVGSIMLSKLLTLHYKKKQYLVNSYAPLGCWLAHNKKYIEDFYKEKTWFGWKGLEKSKRK